jgi:hypothetical protein
MKKLLLVFTVFLLSVASMASNPFSATVKPKRMHASAVMIPIGSEGNKISLLELSTISRSGLENLTGRKMNLTQRLAFKGAQKKIRNGINQHGYVVDKKLNKVFAGDGETGFHIGGFALGFLLGLIGVLIAYLINDEKKRNRVKWSWIGLAAWLVLYLILFAAVF